MLSCAQVDAESSRTDMLFQRFDSNNNGTLERNEIPQQLDKLQKSFGMIDANGDGSLSPSEFSRLGSRGGGQRGQQQPATAPTSKPSASSASTSNVVRMGTTGKSYIDAEILESEAKLTFQSSGGEIWVADLDPETGLFRNPTGKDILMDRGAANLRTTYNGPEFGVDRDGWAVYYTKSYNGELQAWKSELVNGKPVAKPLTRGQKRRQSVLVGKDTSAPAVRMLYLQGSRAGGDFQWIDERNPDNEQFASRLLGVDSPRWIDNTSKFVYVASKGDAAGQIHLVDVTTGKRQAVTNDAGTKTFAYGWRAPDFDNELLLMAMLNYRSVAIYRDMGGPYWTRIAELKPPAESKFNYFGSPEPFVFDGKSYVSLVLKSQNTTGVFKDSEVWIMGIGDNASGPYIERVDDGGAPLMRSDPETFVTDDNVFIYYNAWGSNRVYELHRAVSKLGASKSAGSTPVLTTSAATGSAPEGPVNDIHIQTLNWHDPARKRSFRTLAYVPEVKDDGRGLPLVLLSPGMGGSDHDYAYLANDWSRHGYLTLVFDHPDSNRDMFEKGGRQALARAVQDKSNVVKRVGDIVFVMDQISGPDSPLKSPRIDPERIAVAGHSYGAFTSMSIAGLTFSYQGERRFSLHDERPVAIIAMGPQGIEDRFFNTDKHSWDGIRVPVMTMTGTKDRGSRNQDWTWRNDPFNYMPAGSKYHVVIEGAGHNSYYDKEPLIPQGKPQRDPRHHGWIIATTRAFLDAYVQGNQRARDWLDGGGPAAMVGPELSFQTK